jgi:hypothetical protein
MKTQIVTTIQSTKVDVYSYVVWTQLEANKKY